MGQTRYDKAKDFLLKIKQKEGTNIVKTDLFIIEMRKALGDDPKRVILPYIKLMKDFNLISEEDENVRIN